MLNHGGNFSSQIQAAASSQNMEGEAQFALSSNEGSVLLIKMPPLNIQGSQLWKWNNLDSSCFKRINRKREKSSYKYVNNKRGLVFTVEICGYKSADFFLEQDLLYLVVRIFWFWYWNADLIRVNAIVDQVSDMAPRPLVLFTIAALVVFILKITSLKWVVFHFL